MKSLANTTVRSLVRRDTPNTIKSAAINGTHHEMLTSAAAFHDYFRSFPVLYDNRFGIYTATEPIIHIKDIYLFIYLLQMHPFTYIFMVRSFSVHLDKSVSLSCYIAVCNSEFFVLYRQPL